MPHPHLTHLGEPFEVVEVWTERVCRCCFRVIRVRERCGVFKAQPPAERYECRDCLYDEPLTQHNKWRPDHEQHNEPARDGSRTTREGAGPSSAE